MGDAEKRGGYQPDTNVDPVNPPRGKVTSCPTCESDDPRCTCTSGKGGRVWPDGTPKVEHHSAFTRYNPCPDPFHDLGKAAFACESLLCACTDSECDVTMQPTGGWTVQVEGCCYDYPDWSLSDAVCDAYNNWRSDRSYNTPTEGELDRRQANEDALWRDGFAEGYHKSSMGQER
jgi:hypothetical protein